MGRQSIVAMKTETALEWFQHTQGRHFIEDPTGPSSASWAFCKGRSGISLIDSAYRNDCDVVGVLGIEGFGKTWTVISLAARFVVSTRASQVANGDHPASKSLLEGLLYFIGCLLR